MRTLAVVPECDVAVVGGGVVGLTAAILFADAGYRVSIIEPQQDRDVPTGPIGLRTYALTPAARCILQATGAWSRLEGSRIGAFSRMAVWDAETDGRLDFTAPPTHHGPMGHIVEHQALIAALIAAVETRPAINWRRARLAALVTAMPALLELDDGNRLSSRLALGADGAHSRLRELAGIGHHAVPYAQSALVCNIVTARAHEGVARQRFLTEGPVALLPLADDHACAVVWSMPTAAADHLAGVSPGACAVAIGEAVELVLGAVTEVGERACFALERSAARAYVSGSVALLGDAAHVVHPLAGQGLNLGLMDAAALVECLGPQGRRELWPAAAALRRYQRWRMSEALAMTLVTDALHHLFHQRAAPLRGLRALGMRATDNAEPLKSWLIARAMGVAGDLPRLARRAP